MEKLALVDIPAAVISHPPHTARAPAATVITFSMFVSILIAVVSFTSAASKFVARFVAHFADSAAGYFID